MQNKFKVFAIQASLALVVLAPFLMGCSRDNRTADMVNCTAKAEAEAAHGQLPYLNPADSAEVRHDKIGSEIAECMATVGYHHDSSAMVDERCVDDVDFNAYCYKRAT